MNLNRYLDARKRLIDTTLDKYIPKPTEYPQVLHRSIRYVLFPGGKRIRPILSIVTCEACGGNIKDAILAACGIELIHTYTLVHDDLPSIDNDDFRRNKLTCHKKFGEAIAVLTGDALLTLGFEFLSKGDNSEKQLRIIREISRAIGTLGTIGGQVVDIQMAKSKEQRVKSKRMKNRLDYINLHKTASLIAASVKIGGILAGAEEERIEALEVFGKDIGVVFQLTDDLIDQDGYVKLLGRERTKTLAERLTQRAKNRLKFFGKRANILKGLADLILNRKF